MTALPRLAIRRFALSALPFTLAVLAALAGVQQSERGRANEPQIQMAEDAALSMSHGEDPQHLIPRSTAPADLSQAPFGILLDDAGSLRGSSAPWSTTIPVPPAGVIADARAHGETRRTWSPRPGLRLAAVVRKVNGGPGGFVVVARSLRETEWRIARIARLLALLWLVGLALIAALSLERQRLVPDPG